MLDLLIVADDRTGALEVAAAVADRSGERVLMVPWAALGDDPAGAIAASAPAGTVVVDLGSRHLDAIEAAHRAAAVAAVTARRHAHKMDSALRGNWAVEVAGRIAARPRPVVVAVALPAVGRHVAGGEVRQWVDGRAVPIAEVMAADPRRPPSSSRPADHLRAAGLGAVVDAVAVGGAGPGPGDVVVPDLDGDADLHELAAALVDADDVLLVGTAAAIAATVDGPGRRPSVEPPAADHVVVVVGSRHERARRQAEWLAAQPRVTLVVAPDELVAEPDRVAAELAATAARAVAAAAGRVVRVILGGDTAAAVLGDEPRVVRGSVGAGTSRSTGLGAGDEAVTRAGSFGDDRSLVELVDRLLGA